MPDINSVLLTSIQKEGEYLTKMQKVNETLVCHGFCQGIKPQKVFFFWMIGSSKSTTVQHSNSNIPLQMSGRFAEPWQHAWLGPKTNGQDVASFFPSLFSRSKVADKLEG